MKHGGDIYTDQNPTGRKLIDFSSNSNPYGPPAAVYDVLADALEKSMKYPDIEYRFLKSIIGKYHGIDEKNIVLGNGASEIIDLSMLGIKSILMMIPSYSEYEESAGRNEVAVKKIEFRHVLSEKGSYEMKLSIEDIIDAFSRTDALLLAHPNNPDGNMLEKNDIIELVAFARNEHKRIIVDETFFDYSDGKASFIEFIDGEVDLIIIKAITKFYGLPGIRFGYGICGKPSTVKVISKEQIPWNINSFAEMFAIECFSDKEYRMKMNLKNIEERSWLIENLKGIKSIDRVYESNGNYILLKMKNFKSKDVKALLIEKGILIRNCDNYDGLGDDYIRLAVKKRKDNISLLHEMEQLDG